MDRKRKRRRLPEDQSVLSIRLPSELHERLRLLAISNDRSVAQEARRAITQCVKEFEAEVAEAA